MKKNSLHSLIAITVFQLSALSFADALTDSLAGKTIIQDNALSAKKSDGFLYQGTISEDAPGVNGNGLEYKLQDSKNMTNTAAIIAAATGGAMMGAGVPMSMSIIAPVAAAGRVLIAKAIMEFAQAAANGGASGSNGSGEGLLRDNSVYSYESPGAIAQTTKPQMPAGLQDFLNSLGKDSDAFMKNVMNGTYKSEADILAELGLDQIGATEEEIAEGRSIADGLSTQIINDQAKSAGLSAGQELAGLDYQSPSEESIADVGGASGGSASGVASASSSEETKASEAASNGSFAAVSKKASESATAAHSGKVGSVERSLTSILGGFGMPADAAGAAAKALGTGFDPIVLSSLGVKQKVGKENLFSMAHQNFRSFGKWQRVSKKARVAIR